MLISRFDQTTVCRRGKSVGPFSLLRIVGKRSCVSFSWQVNLSLYYTYISSFPTKLTVGTVTQVCTLIVIKIRENVTQEETQSVIVSLCVFVDYFRFSDVTEWRVECTDHHVSGEDSALDVCSLICWLISWCFCAMVTTRFSLILFLRRISHCIYLCT
jgi:hypothetical protein